MDLQILGPLEVYDDEGRVVELGGRQQRLVLAMLLLHRNAVVSTDRLIDVVWGERPPATAAKNIQIHVSRLRKAFDVPPGRTGDGSRRAIIRTRANGYVLELAPGELDIDRFERLVEEGRGAVAADEFERARSKLRDALALWRGKPLADFTYDSFAQSEIGRLEELRLGAVEDRIEIDLALGLTQETIPELQALVAEHPLRERLRGQLMLALYRSGRKAEALRVYDEARRTLAEELGLEPGTSLQVVQRAVLTDEPALSAPRHMRTKAAPVGQWQMRTLVRRRALLLALGGALVLGAALTVAVLEITRDRASAGLAAIAPNSLAAIDPGSNRIVAEVPLGARPASIVSANGSLWVANLDDKTVQRIDPNESRVVRTIPTGLAADGLAAGRGALWAVAGKRDVVLRVDPTFNEVVDRIQTAKVGTVLGGAPATGAIAVTPDAVWAIGGGLLSTPRLFRIDPVTKQVTATLATGNGPTAIASGFGDLWVTDAFENTVSRIDHMGVVIATIPVGFGASAVAVGEGAVWVVDSLDEAVVRIDPDTNSVTTTVAVGRYPTSVAVGAGAVWVANRNDGTISRIDPRSNEVVEGIDLGNSPAGLVVAAGSLWVTTQSAAAAAPEPEARGIARFNVKDDLQTDPALYPDRQIGYATCAKLLNYPDARGPTGGRLVPEVATSPPSLSADRRTYTFTIREGYAFSPPVRERVTAETFKHAIERSLNPRMGVAGYFVSDIVGQRAYESGRASHISGVVADGDRLSIRLVAPAADFPARVAMPFFCAVPLKSPIDPDGVQAIPSAGPFYVAEHVPDERIVLRRNPNYHGSRPQRLREIRYTIGVAPAKSVADIEAGRSDYLADGYIPDDRAAEARLAARYGPVSPTARAGRQQYFVEPWLALAYLALNTSRPLFSDVRWRKAVNYAIDRRALARYGNLVTGPFPAVPTDHYLPPTMLGASRVSLYPPAGDLRVARRLAPDVRATAVLYTCNLPLCRGQAQLIKSNLAPIGLDVDVRQFPVTELFERAGTKGEPFDIVTAHWGFDYADPSDFLNVLLNQHLGARGNGNLAYYTDDRLARKLDRVARISGKARYRAYGALSDELARDDAPWVAYAAGTSRDFFSSRIGCQLFHPIYGIDLAALCLRRERS